MSVSLSKRLACIAGYVAPGSHVIDVGTDHGYIPAYLVENGICERVIASDLRPGPLKRAEMTARNAGVYDKIEFFLCPGLEKCAPDEVDTVIIAGMGGETIIGILEAAPWALEKELILQPQSKQPELRDWLAGHGCAVRDARLVSDTGRLYLVWRVSAGEMAPAGVIDPQLIEERDPLLPVYLDGEIKKKLKILCGMEAASGGGGPALEACRRELEELKALREEVKTWQA
ncbi:MAG: tRNA (adenine(22)-N(1))-methyltransferase [Oscillospiraceae bacterium]